MKVRRIKVDDLKINPNNPRTIKDGKFKKLVKSIVDFPEMLNIRPIVVNSEMVVLGGNMRLRACINAGLKEVPVIIANNLTEDQEREFIIKDNISGGEWDFEILDNEWETEQLIDWGLDLSQTNSGEKEPKDLSDSIEENYLVEVKVVSEREQQMLFEDLTKKGYECRILTL